MFGNTALGVEEQKAYFKELGAGRQEVGGKVNGTGLDV